LWRAGESDAAIAILEELARDVCSEREPALAALLMIGRLSLETVGTRVEKPEESATILLLAMMLRGDPTARALLGQRMSSIAIERQAARLSGVFARSPHHD
jgi:hypothetical protein